MYKPLQILAPQNRHAKNPPLNRPSEYKPPGGLFLEFALEYKVKQSKNGKFPSNYKLAQSILNLACKPMIGLAKMRPKFIKNVSIIICRT